MEYHPTIKELRDFTMAKIAKGQPGVIRRFYDESLEVERKDLKNDLRLAVAKREDDDGLTIFVRYSATPDENVVYHPCDVPQTKEIIQAFIEIPSAADLSPIMFIQRIQPRP